MKKPRPKLDLSRSLNQMLGYNDVHDDRTGLTARYSRAMSAPAGSLDVAQIEMLLSQSPTDDERSLLVPIAVERLASDFFGWCANLLLVDVARNRHVLAAQPAVQRRAVEIVVAHADVLATFDGLRSEEAVDAALTLVDHDPAALAALEGACARAGNRERAGQVQQRRLARAKTADARVAVLVDIARSCEPHDSVEAAYAWFDVLVEAPGHEQASAEADRLFTLYEVWSTVAHVLELRAEARLARGDSEGALADLARAADLAVTRLDSAELLERTSARITQLRGL
ncbi:hypothetical protein [Nannocystis punicea]|uniref:Tetratricopeptide repeat-containing protein n=1 Tax=Nannocystis punicea TaxID=2995304 RepID=A0ABY7GS29_9BACT|nr:hypothetical protein [Nannocystis poenicansa]WAS89766.1 hypothetical protein O0S08_26535 [Nannocystis poenicansa]